MAPTTAVWLNVNVGEVIGKKIRNGQTTTTTIQSSGHHSLCIQRNHMMKFSCMDDYKDTSELKYFTMLESDELICLSSHLLDSNTLRGLYKVDKVAFLSHLVGDMHISMVSRIVMSMARILIYICYAPGSG
ncbi:hypothetical protein Tsp_13051 [Trichinella spiralis]|uniref:hypothetical protein n=1 Tax=Trichinella spiralis TaxID=6334 RepID=UPI0001EFDC66|nr:hypothetical protein Tsp_13051 [Trichinella spiralis]